jgi:ornithine cyclodeaminase
MLDSVGFTLEVFAALHHVQGLALAPGIGQRMALVPHLADPKSLFGLLGAVHTPVRQAP